MLAVTRPQPVLIVFVSKRPSRNMGGPGPRDILTLLAAESANPAEDCDVLHGARVQCPDRGTDAHAKNDSVLLDRARARLAPLYVASALP